MGPRSKGRASCLVTVRVSWWKVPPMIDRDRFEGCLLGLALGDALGAPLEGGPLERLVWRLIGRTRQGEMRWTDDTQMSLDVAESLTEHGRIDPDDLARRFADSYRWSWGYGPGAAKLLKCIKGGADWQEANRSVFPDGSYGNGGAMRAAPIGLFFASRPRELADAARRAARVTHAHPLGEVGAVLVAASTASAALGESRDAVLAAATRHCVLEDSSPEDSAPKDSAPKDSPQENCAKDPFRSRLELAKQWFDSGDAPSAQLIRQHLGNGIATTESCVTAIYCALRFAEEPFLEMQNFIASVGGDVDTIGAMAGAVWGAANGARRLPPEPLAKLEQRERLVTVAAELHGKCGEEA